MLAIMREPARRGGASTASVQVALAAALLAVLLLPSPAAAQICREGSNTLNAAFGTGNQDLFTPVGSADGAFRPQVVAVRSQRVSSCPRFGRDWTPSVGDWATANPAPCCAVLQASSVPPQTTASL